MAKRNLGERIKLQSYDEMFGLDTISPGDQKPEGQIVNIPLNELYEFKDHPFRVLDDEKMEETVESIKAHGVLMPGIARPRKEGGYEIISGHRRRRASELAGKTEMPFIIKDYSDDEATVIMVDSNIQREDILISEKAKAYHMKYMAMKHQGTAEIIPFRRKLRLFDIPVSAGTGSILDGDNYEEIEVGAEVPDEADFGLRISGDSMEPQFINGQIVWVKQQNYLEDGEIGIFFLDGSGYIKKLQDNKDGHNLISLNKAYKPIPIVEDSNFMIFGKVIG